MIRETELNLFVPSPELLVRLASGERPFGVRAGPPRIKALRETFFDTTDHALRRRGMTCKLRQVEGEEPSVVVTVGEDPDSEGITSRSRLTAEAIGAGVFETLRGDSDLATQIQKFVEPSQLRPQIALDIQRLGRVYRGGLLLKPVLLLFFDRITVQVSGTSSVFHEISIRRRRAGGPQIRDISKELRDKHHLFPDGLNRLQRAYRILAVGQKTTDVGMSPYGLNLALAVFRDEKLGLIRKGNDLHIPTFRGSGEDAARALSADLTGATDRPLSRLGTTEPREGRAVAELWSIEDPELNPEGLSSRDRLIWFPWQLLLEEVGRQDLRNPTLVSTLLLLTRKKLLGQLPWIEGGANEADVDGGPPPPTLASDETSPLPPELRRLESLLPILREVENAENDLGTRLKAASRLSKDLDRIFFQDVTRAKGRILSGDTGEGEEAPIQLVDLMSIRIRGIVDRLDSCFVEDLSEELEKANIQLRTWVGLTQPDRMALLDQFSSKHFPTLQIAPEWGPSFVPDMPLSGSAVGLLARTPGVDGTRFFHVVLRKDPPSFLPIPGTPFVVPLEEVIKGYFLTQVPELERAETFTFRFTTGAATVRERAPRPDPSSLDPSEEETGTEETGTEETGTEETGTEETGTEETAERGSAVPAETNTAALVDLGPPAPAEVGREGSSEPDPVDAPPLPLYVETRQSVVVRVIAHRKMPESYQAQLIRALERQVSRKNPLIGWSDLYPVTGPLELSGCERLLDLQEEW